MKLTSKLMGLVLVMSAAFAFALTPVIANACTKKCDCSKKHHHKKKAATIQKKPAEQTTETPAAQ